MTTTHGTAVSHDSLAEIGPFTRTLRSIAAAAGQIAIVTHANLDADAVSSALGLAQLLQDWGTPPAGVQAGDGNLPNNLRFIAESGRVTQVDDDLVRGCDLLIFVDCSDETRVGPLWKRFGAVLLAGRTVINIDHHVSNTRFGNHNLVVPVAASTAEIIVDMFTATNTPIDPTTATTLLAGIYGDTLGLRTPSTTAHSLRAASVLIDCDADLDGIVDALYRKKPASTIALWGEVLSAAQWEQGLIWTQVTDEMLARAGAEREEAEGIVNFLAGAIGARASALLHENPQGWRVSMRTLSDDVDVAVLLGRFGGGGHKRAAGASLEPGPEARDAFITAVADILGPPNVETVIPGHGEER